jgi:hypothetical protein
MYLYLLSILIHEMFLGAQVTSALGNNDLFCTFRSILGSHSNGYEGLLGYNAVWSAESQPTFPRNVSPPSSRSKDK